MTGHVALAAHDASTQLTTSPVRSWQPPNRLGQEASEHCWAARAPSRAVQATSLPRTAAVKDFGREPGSTRARCRTRTRGGRPHAGTPRQPKITTSTYLRRPS